MTQRPPQDRRSLELYHGCVSGIAHAQSCGFLLHGHTSHTSAGALAALQLALPSRRAKTCPAANSSCTGNSLSQTVTSWYLSLAAIIFIAHSTSEATCLTFAPRFAANRDLDVEGLCRGFPKRLRKLEEREGGRLKH